MIRCCLGLQFDPKVGSNGVGDIFSENKTSELLYSEIIKRKKEKKKPELSNSEII